MVFQRRRRKKGIHAGVGIVIDNKEIQHVEDIEPIDDRLMTITLKSKKPLTIINTHPQQTDPQKKKRKTTRI